MTDQEHRAISLLQRCSFHPGTWAKRFVRDLVDQAHEDPDRELTEKQRAWLMRTLHSYRGQHKHCFCEACQRVETERKQQLVLF